VAMGGNGGYPLQETTTYTEQERCESSQRWTGDPPEMVPTPLSASAPAFRNCVGVGRVNEDRRRLRSGEEDGVRVNDDGGGRVDTGIDDIGFVFWKRDPSCCILGGTRGGIEGDASGVSMPFSHRVFLTRDAESSLLATELGRLSRDEDAPRQKVDVFGLGNGDEVGVRRGDGSGNSWSSSSSAIGETLGVSFEDRGSSSLLSLETDDSISCSLTSCECRLLSTSSTLSPSFAEKLELASEGVMPTNPVESKLELRLLLAALENFSCHSTPSFKLSSVICKQFSQQERRGMVTTSARGDIGRETRRD
jgi:hypothetical protein